MAKDDCATSRHCRFVFYWFLPHGRFRWRLLRQAVKNCVIPICSVAPAQRWINNNTLRFDVGTCCRSPRLSAEKTVVVTSRARQWWQHNRIRRVSLRATRDLLPSRVFFCQTRVRLASPPAWRHRANGRQARQRHPPPRTPRLREDPDGPSDREDAECPGTAGEFERACDLIRVESLSMTPLINCPTTSLIIVRWRHWSYETVQRRHWWNRKKSRSVARLLFGWGRSKKCEEKNSAKHLKKIKLVQ